MSNEMGEDVANLGKLGAETMLLLLLGGVVGTLTAFTGGASDAAWRIPKLVAVSAWFLDALAPAVFYATLGVRRHPRMRLFAGTLIAVLPLNLIFFYALISSGFGFWRAPY